MSQDFERCDGAVSRLQCRRDRARSFLHDVVPSPASPREPPCPCPIQLCQEHPATLLSIRVSSLRTMVLLASDKGSAMALEVVLDACRVAAGGPREFRALIDVPDSKGNSALALAAKNW